MQLPYKIEIIADEAEDDYVLFHPELPGCLICADSAEKGIALPSPPRRIQEAKEITSMCFPCEGGEKLT